MEAEPKSSYNRINSKPALYQRQSPLKEPYNFPLKRRGGQDFAWRRQASKRSRQLPQADESEEERIHRQPGSEAENLVPSI